MERDNNTGARALVWLVGGLLIMVLAMRGELDFVTGLTLAFVTWIVSLFF